MKAIYLNTYGAPEIVKIKEMSKPTPAADEILVHMVAAPLTQACVMMRKGTPRFARLFLGLRGPKSPIPGTGLAGVVEAVGEDVTNFAVGDEVFGETALGFSTHAEYVAVKADGVVLRKPESLSFEDVAPLCDGAVTSWNFLHRIAKVKAGQRVLINGASGGLGTIAVQIAKTAGAHVTGVCSARNAELVRKLGADRVIDYAKSDYTAEREKYDIIYDTLGLTPYRKARRVLTEAGQYLSPVLSVGLLVQVFLSGSFGKKRARFSATGILPKEELRPMLSAVTEKLVSGEMQTIVDRLYALDDAAEAHGYVEAGHKVGNVILQMRQQTKLLAAS